MSTYYHHVPRYCGIQYIPKTTVVKSLASRTQLTQTFINPSSTSPISKAKYTFPLYESCAVTSFRCYIGQRLIEGVVKEKEEAKLKYKEAIERGETAGLLEQSTPDVFSTNLGNIPAGGMVKVEIEYIMELKHDSEIDGLRFTIPTSIAPRYGEAPSVGAYDQAYDQVAGMTDKNRMMISVQVTIPSHVRNISSPSHTISVHLGGHVEDSPDDSFDPKCALASLSQTSIELGKDFILLVKCSDLSSPRALLETHPTIPDSKALMVTLVPKFTLPPGPKPEIVFVVDRSGSMTNRMEPLKSSLGVFLKSLPLGVMFNICSFGTSHSFLWTKSRPYSAESLEEAQRHISSMQADFGGTEILPPLISTVSMRHRDLSLEIMVLTDGEVWRPEELYKYIEEATADGDVRLFTLGIGQDVSHALVEGMARVGRGFAQIVSDGKEGMEGKVVRMLRGGLSAHIKDYRTRSKTSAPMAASKAKKISLFDTKADLQPPISFSHLPEFGVPSIIQAPYKIPPLFPFSRSTAYAIFFSEAPTPPSVWLRGTTPSGDDLELEIQVQTMKDGRETIHQLAGRKVLQELEECTGYLHSGKYGVDKTLNSGTFEEWVKREGVRVGMRYGLASKWTSFLAITKREDKGKGKGKDEVMDDSPVDEEETEYEFIPSSASSDSVGGGVLWNTKPATSITTGYYASPMNTAASPPSNPFQFASSAIAPAKSLSGGGAKFKAQQSGFGAIGSLQAQSSSLSHRPPPSVASSFSAPLPKPSYFGGGMPPPPPPPSGSGIVGFGMEPPVNMPFGATFKAQQSGFGAIGSLQAQSSSLSHHPPPSVPSSFSAPLPKPSYFGGGIPPPPLSPPSGGFGSGIVGFGMEPPVNMPVQGEVKESLKERERVSLTDRPSERPEKRIKISPEPQDPHQRTMNLVALPSFEGFFSFTPALAAVLGSSFSHLEAKLDELLPTVPGLDEAQRKRLFATLLAVGSFERELAREMNVWELVVEKARTWIIGLVGNNEATSIEMNAGKFWAN